MKKCLFFLFISYSSLAQESQIDFLINKIDNSNLGWTCNYNWVFKNLGSEAETLIKLGRDKNLNNSILYKKLINKLTDPDKGIIIHYVLSQIFYPDQKIKYCHEKEKSEEIEFNFNRLTFYQTVIAHSEFEENSKINMLIVTDYLKIFTDQNRLKNIKLFWKKILKKTEK